jgi:hypothetical protein
MLDFIVGKMMKQIDHLGIIRTFGCLPIKQLAVLLQSNGKLQYVARGKKLHPVFFPMNVVMSLDNNLTANNSRNSRDPCRQAPSFQKR